MIDEALSAVCRELNEFIRAKLHLNEDKVALSNLVGQDGQFAVEGENQVLCTLFQVEQDRLGITDGRGSARGLPVRSNAPLRLNLYVLFSAYFGKANYAEALKFLSLIIAFFQGKFLFTSRNSTLPGTPDRLVFELHNLSVHDTSNMWSSLGSKHMPHVVYRVRHLLFDEGRINEFGEFIRRVEGDVEAPSKGS